MVSITLGGNEVIDAKEEQTKALHEVSAAWVMVQAAKRTHSDGAVARAELQLHAAVDVARSLDVEWGPHRFRARDCARLCL